MTIDPPESRTREARTRPWPVTALALLIFLEAVGLAGIGYLNLRDLPTDWTFDVWALFLDVPLALRGTAFFLLAAGCLPIVLGFLRLWPGAWLYAMGTQAAVLLIALVLYFSIRPFYVHGLMAYAVFIVAYLNYSEVQIAFRPPTPPESLEIES